MVFVIFIEPKPKKYNTIVEAIPLAFCFVHSFVNITVFDLLLYVYIGDDEDELFLSFCTEKILFV